MSILPAILGGPPVRSAGAPAWPVPDPEIDAVLRQVAADGSWGRYYGPYCERLVADLQRLFAVEHVQLTCSGTAAVELALRGVGVGAGDEVLLAAYDFKANFTNITLLGAMPVLVDVREFDGQLDSSLLETAVSQKTKAILVSHLHGGCVDMRAAMEFAERRNLAVIEDACQLPRAIIQGRVAGTWGDVGVISFGGSKTLTAGRGGAICTSNAQIAQRIQLHTQRGNNAYPLSELQAAVLLPQLPKLESRQQQRAQAAEAIRQRLGDASCLRPFSPLGTCSPDFYKLGFRYNAAGLDGLSRDRFCSAVRAEGIPLDPGFRSLHRIHARKRFRTVGELTVADRLDGQAVVLHHPFLLEGDRGVEEFFAALDKISQHATLLAAHDKNFSQIEMLADESRRQV